MLFDQVANPIVALLATAALVAFAFDERLEALGILVVLVVNTAIGFVTEQRAVRAMEALRNLGRVQSNVRRGGAAGAIPADQLVPGDIVLLDAGDVITADLRILQASRLQADESTLTGESLPIDKEERACEPETGLADRRSMLWKGTAITRGSGEAVVVAIGMETELGQISRLVEESEPEVTPLEARLERLGRRLILLTLVITALVGAASFLGGRDLYLSIELALALAVASVPEGLPIVATVALARGMLRMARRNALVQKLSAVETLGSTSILIVDKTGTLTENRMVMAELALADDLQIRFDTGRHGMQAFRTDESALEAPVEALVRRALRVASLCNNAELASPTPDRGDSRPDEPDASFEGIGDPTEVALLLAAREAGLDRDALLRDLPEVTEVAFDSETKRMATIHREPEGSLTAAIKGAPESIVAACTRVEMPDGTTRTLDEAARADWLERADALASRGQRVLGLASKRVEDASAFRYGESTLLGLVGLLDPPRRSAMPAIEACRAAGIRTVMVTGDHAGTAAEIARSTGLLEKSADVPGAVLDASRLVELAAPGAASSDAGDPAVPPAVFDAQVIARATPKQKLDLIAGYQRRGAVVAMTGDGVNDAPALKKADIGIAMGKRGTQVAREAADMILRDDELRTIVAAVEQGRAIFDNIRKFVVYLLSCNLSEILAIGIATLAQLPLPLLPLQILFLNLVTDVFPALALGVGEGAPSLMQRPPRPASEAMIERKHWARIFWFGAVIALAVLAALVLALEALGKSAHEATSISFVTLSLAQLWHVLNVRDKDSGWLRNEVTRNPWIWGAIGLCIVLIALAVVWPPLAIPLSLVDPGFDGWLLAIGASFAPLLLGQASLYRRRRGAAT